MRLVARMLAALAAVFLATVGDTAPGWAEKRVALVIGNSAYTYIPRLANSANDAKLMAETLRGLGFALVGHGPQLDLDKAGFDRAVQSFGDQLQGAEVALFYYAGHGVQVRGANYLVPVGANPEKEADVDFQMLDANLVLRQMEGSRTRLNLVVLDACRNNPFGGRGLRSAGSGLAQMQAPDGTLISFATQPGNVALDGTAGNSPFTRALAEVIRQPGLGLFDAFNQVGLRVKQETGGAQQPWVSSSPISGSFYFAGRSSVADTKNEEVVSVHEPPKTLEQQMRVETAKPSGDLRVTVGTTPKVGSFVARRISTLGYSGSQYVEAEFNRDDASGTWTETQRTDPSARFVFTEQRRTSSEILLYDDLRDLSLRFDLVKRRLFFRMGNQGSWVPFYKIVDVQRE